MILATRFAFIVARSWKNVYFHQNMASPPATYDVISCYHTNWPSLNLSQNVREGWRNSYWKRQVLMSYPLGKKLRKTLVGGGGGGAPPGPPPPQLTVRLNCTSEGYYNLRYISECAIPTFCSFVIIIKYNLLQYLFHAIRYPSDVILYFIT